MNNSSSADINTYKQYIGFGFAAITTNLIVIFVLARNFQLLSKSALIFGLALADVINGLALFITGILRTHYHNIGIARNLVHPFKCLQNFTFLWLIGVQLPPVMMALIGMERMIAVSCFMWYFKKWTNLIPWLLTLIAYTLCSFSLISIWSVTYNLPQNATTSINCVTPFVVGKIYSSYMYGLAIISGTTAVVLTVASLVTFLARKMKFQTVTSANLSGHMKKQWQLTTSMTCLAVLDFCLVVIPNIMLLLIGTFSAHFPPSLGNVGEWSASVFCLRSSLSLFVYIIFNREFRRAFLRTIGVNYVVTPVVPFSPTVNSLSSAQTQ